jgi:predicted nicotinamide N-methyase
VQVISRHGSSASSLNVLELGCGTGLIGLSLAMLLENCRVTMTDLSSGTALAELNISNNRSKFAPGSDTQFRVLKWATLPPWLAEYQLVVVGDCIYNPDSYEDLLTTLNHVSDNETLIILASKVRHEAETAFDHLLLKGGFVQRRTMTVPLTNEEHVADEVVYIKTLSKSGSSIGWIQKHPLLGFFI